MMVEDYTIIQFGKYKGKNISEIISSDPKYCIWTLSKSFIDNYPEIKKIIESNFKIDDIILWFGKHKNKSLTWIKENDNKYIQWLKQYDYVVNNEKCKELRDALAKL